MIKGINNRIKPKGFNKINSINLTIISNGFWKKNWIMKNKKTAVPNSRKNKSALIDAKRTNKIIKKTIASKNFMI